ncbi:Uncharacterised protein [Mycobacteroides abscessus subsp. abscessus]|uniref:hypothetical protein n=1 Tax=Mycobacteroides abscessus TaxID=36809 RepID=UPI00092BD0CC|nr:hypothetical protein [Mycobacteroides abscessus]MBE5513750.1 hypothetical protein [Mycobacteroides abscessus]MBN7327703.1 hypothetical protein [Mycobacteroides abscessus subsp. abscessus]SID62388.1 Uncharacterised protein [Mycobacteroides abscessus subsp. abscessus]SIE83234.1 Uncharacterised protein [Mycobacteroides abscessus subsp. abscessus]SIF72592.1 Uncharacterised protein [Mycobacteroides abscessus subsp. abscessus]
MAKPAKKFNPREWVVHPNRSEPGPDEPGRNGHFRSLRRPPPTAAEPADKCMVRVELPRSMSHLADPDGSRTFGGDDWWFAVGVAHTFARLHTEVEVPNPFGFRDRGKYYWWDGAVTDESRLGGPDEIRYVEEFFERLFPGMPITVTDLR